MAESDTEIPNNESSKIETALNASTECNDSIIRPSALEDFAGQEKTVTRLSIMVGAALSQRASQPYFTQWPSRLRQDYFVFYSRT